MMEFLGKEARQEFSKIINSPTCVLSEGTQRHIARMIEADEILERVIMRENVLASKCNFEVKNNV